MKPQTRNRAEIPDICKWDLAPIFAAWEDWRAAYARLETLIATFANQRGSLADGRHAKRGRSVNSCRSRNNRR